MFTNFWIWGFQPYKCTICTARFGQFAPILAKRCLGYFVFPSPSPSSSLSLTLLLILRLSRTCVYAVLWRRSNEKWTQWVSEWVMMSPIEGFIINFDWKILCKCSLIRLLKAIQLFLQAALPKTNNKPISISVCSLLQKLISRGNVWKLGT